MLFICSMVNALFRSRSSSVTGSMPLNARGTHGKAPSGNPKRGFYIFVLGRGHLQFGEIPCG